MTKRKKKTRPKHKTVPQILEHITSCLLEYSGSEAIESSYGGPSPDNGKRLAKLQAAQEILHHMRKFITGEKQ